MTLYFGDDIKIGKLVYSVLQQKPEKRPEMKQVLVQMVEIKVEQRLKSMSIRHALDALDVVNAQNNDLQDQNSSLKDELTAQKN